MSTSIMATMCAERLTKILVRYSRAPQTTLVRNESLSQSHVQCPVRSVNPLPRSEATVAYLKPLASGGLVPSLGTPPAKWQSLASFSNIGQKLQQAKKSEQPLVSMSQKFQQPKKTEQPLLRPQLNIQNLPGKSRVSQGWKHLGSTRYSAPFASIFQGQKQVPLKHFGQDSIAFHALQSRFPCLPCQ